MNTDILLTLTEIEAKNLMALIDTAVKALGLQGAVVGVGIAEKLQKAFDEKKAG